jgi:capsular exopolysaccharide synthesis family protein
MAPPILKRFLISLDQNKWLGIIVGFAVFGISIVVAVQPPPAPPRPTFRASGELSFRTPPPIFTSTGTQLEAQGRAVSREMLLSPWVLQQVDQKLQLTEDQWTKLIKELQDNKLVIIFPSEGQNQAQNKGNNQAQNPAPAPAPQNQPDNQPQVIKLQYTDPDSPTRATLVLRTFMDSMVEYSRWLNTSQLRARIEALSKRLGLVQKDLTQAEERFYRYITREGSDLLAIQDGSLFSGITTSQQKQRELQLAVQELDGQIGSLTKQLGLNPEQAYTQQTFSADPIIASLRARILDNETQLERLKKDLRSGHPTIVKLRKDKAVNEKLLQERAQELIGKDGILVPLPSQIRKESNLDPARQQLATQLVTLQTQREGLIKQLASVVKTEQELRQQYEKFPDKQLQQARLVQAVEYQRVIYQNILSALTDAQSAEAETSSSLTITQEPIIQPPQPVDNKQIPKWLILVAGAGIGSVSGLAIILLLAFLDDRLHTPQELRDALASREVPLLGQLPIILSLDLNEPANPILLDADSSYLPFYERFRSNIRRLKPETSKVVIVTSITNEEGKSVTAYNLAIASAHAGKRTLLVEADLRVSTHADWLQIRPFPEARLEPLRYYATRMEAISLVPSIANLYVLPSPGPQRQAAAIIESSELQLLLKDARGRFDMVIIDTPSLSKCNDALLLESLTDGIILVTRPGITRSSLLSEAVDQFAEAEVSLLGAAINCVEELTPAFPLASELTPSEGEEQAAESEEEGATVEV